MPPLSHHPTPSFHHSALSTHHPKSLTSHNPAPPAHLVLPSHHPNTLASYHPRHPAPASSTHQSSSQQSAIPSKSHSVAPSAHYSSTPGDYASTPSGHQFSTSYTMSYSQNAPPTAHSVPPTSLHPTAQHPSQHASPSHRPPALPNHPTQSSHHPVPQASHLPTPTPAHIPIVSTVSHPISTSDLSTRRPSLPDSHYPTTPAHHPTPSSNHPSVQPSSHHLTYSSTHHTVPASHSHPSHFPSSNHTNSHSSRHQPPITNHYHPGSQANSVSSNYHQTLTTSDTHPSSKGYGAEYAPVSQSYYSTHPSAYSSQYQGYATSQSVAHAHVSQPVSQSYLSQSINGQAQTSSPQDKNNSYSTQNKTTVPLSAQPNSLKSFSYPVLSDSSNVTPTSLGSQTSFHSSQQSTHLSLAGSSNDRINTLPTTIPSGHSEANCDPTRPTNKNEPSSDAKLALADKKQPLKEWGQLRPSLTKVESLSKSISEQSHPALNKKPESQVQPEVKLEFQDNTLKSSSGSEPGKAALVEKLQKKVKKEFPDDACSSRGQDDEEEKIPNHGVDDLDIKFEKLIDDLASHKDSVTSKKSCILGRRYNQKVQLQNAVDNDEVMMPEPYPDEEEDMESEREEPVKKFRGKFRSIKDKAVERVILTYASHSDESATEMIPDEDASDFEEELIREIEAKARKGKGKGRALKRERTKGNRSSGESERERSDHPSHRRTDKRRGKSDEDFTLSSSSYNDSSFSSQVSSSSDDDSNSSSPSFSASSASTVAAARKNKNIKRKNRHLTARSTSTSRSRSPTSSSSSSSSSTSNSDDEFLPKRKTRRSKKLSSDEDSFKASESDLKGMKGKRSGGKKKENIATRRKGRKTQKGEISDEERKSSPKRRRRKRRKEGGRIKAREENSDTEENLSRRKRNAKRKQESLKMKLLKKKRPLSSSDSDDEEHAKVPSQRGPNKKPLASDSDLKSKARKTKQPPVLEESEPVNKVDLTQTKVAENKESTELALDNQEDSVSLLGDVELLAQNETDSVLLKLKEVRDEEFRREDVLEMKLWRETATGEVMKLLEDFLETKWRHSWKKPTFGVDEFKKGWQGEVKRFKTDVARIPQVLVSVPPLPVSISSSQADSKACGVTSKKGKEGNTKKGKTKGSPAKNTRSKSGIIKTSMNVPENQLHKVAARPEISNVMERFFEKVLGVENPLGTTKKFPSFAPFTPVSRSPTGLTPTPSLALSLRASDDSDRDSLASLRTDLPASDSVPVAPRRSSIANSLIKKLRKKYKDNKVDTQWLNKSRPLLETNNKPRLLPTPGLSTNEDTDSNAPTRYNQMRLVTFFRKDSVNRYRETFDDVNFKNGINEFTPVLAPSRTRNKTKAILDAATIRAVFGEDPLPLLSSPPKNQQKASKEEGIKVKNQKKSVFVHQDLKRKDLKGTSGSTPTIHSQSPIPSSISHCSTPVDSLFNDDDDSEIRSERSEATLQELAIMQGIRKSRKKLRKFRKFRSGFDYIRKKKKAKTEEELHASKKRMPARKRMLWPEESRDVANEVRNWMINKGLGETVLHKAARLQYHDVVTYCLESSDFNVNAKDNAGYTPLHEACCKGHLDIAQILCAHHAHVNASGCGGMRPLHEAIENGYIELARLLLSYGADPSLSTYGGQTCLALASNPQTERFLTEYLADLKGKKASPWYIAGPARFFDLTEQGTDIFADTPVPALAPPPSLLKPEQDKPSLSESTAITASQSGDKDANDLPDLLFECSTRLLPDLYVVTGREGRYFMLRDLLQYLSMTRIDLIKAAGSIETLHLSPEDHEKKLKSQVIGYKVLPRSCPRGNVTLVKYTFAIEKLLDVEFTVVGDSSS